MPGLAAHSAGNGTRRMEAGMHGQFLQDLALVMIVAGFVTVVFHRLRQPVVLGYILAGYIVGPYTPGIPLSVHDYHTVEIMSDLGMIMLMFSLGLHFSLRKLAQVGGTAFTAAVLEIVIMLAIGYGIGRMFNWNRMDSLFLGAILSISSTTIIIKALGELGLTKERFAELIFGILIVEDILAIAMLALLSGIAVSGSLEVGAVVLTLGKLAIFLASVLVIGLLAVPPLLRYVSKFKSSEMLLIVVLGLCFGVSLLAMKLGYSVALGAFLIGAVVAEAREHHKIEGLVEPVRDMFSAVFFVAIGMLIQPDMLIKYALPILVITIAVVIGKVFSCTLGTFLAGNNARTSMRVGMGLAQIGEFSFIIASLGRTLGVTSEFLYPIAVTVSAITTLLTPYLIMGSDKTERLLASVAPRPVIGYVRWYTTWLSRLTGGGTISQVRKLVRRWILQILLNMTLVTGIFIAAEATAIKMKESLPRMPEWTGGPEAVVWLGAVLLSLPLLIVTHFKLRALALLASEAAVTKDVAKDRTQSVRAVFTATIRVLGSVALILWLLVLTAAMMPPLPVLLVLGVGVGLVVALRRKSFENFYARAQLNLRETLSRPPEVYIAEDAPRTLPSILQEAQLETVEIALPSPARGKLIRELQLRSRSGASAVAIERSGSNIVNPGPDEELQDGDKVLLLGNREQLDAARGLLLGLVP